MGQHPYREDGRPPVSSGPEGDRFAAKAASIALVAIVIACFLFQDRAPSENLVVVGLFLSVAVLIAAWRAGKPS